MSQMCDGSNGFSRLVHEKKAVYSRSSHSRRLRALTMIAVGGASITQFFNSSVRPHLYEGLAGPRMGLVLAFQ